jgi:hypothetical protein
MLELFRGRESGVGPDTLTLEQALAFSIRGRAIHGAQKAPIDQSFLG